jgi:hypothetical protein
MKKVKLSSTARYQWMCKEEGSWEDHNRPKTGHIYCILQNQWKKGVLSLNTPEEIKLVQRSAAYQTSWEFGESDATDTLILEANKLQSF